MLSQFAIVESAARALGGEWFDARLMAVAITPEPNLDVLRGVSCALSNLARRGRIERRRAPFKACRRRFEYRLPLEEIAQPLPRWVPRGIL
jgi:hypothetical protein